MSSPVRSLVRLFISSLKFPREIPRVFGNSLLSSLVRLLISSLEFPGEFPRVFGNSLLSSLVSSPVSPLVRSSSLVSSLGCLAMPS